MSKHMLVVCAALVFVYASPGTPHAATRLTDDFDSLVKTAEEIVEAEVTSRAVIIRAQMPWTVVNLKVSRAYKGRIAAGTEVAVEFPGGFDGTYEVVVSGQPQLSSGRRVLALLVQYGESSSWRMLSGNYGQVNLYQNLNGEERARRETGSFKYYVADSGSLSGYQAVAQADIDAGQLRTLLNVIMKTGRPVIDADPPQPASKHESLLPQASAASTANVTQLPNVCYALIVAVSGVVIRRRRKLA